MHTLRYAAAALSLSAIAVAACSQEAQQPAAVTGFSAEALRAGTVVTNGGEIRATRVGGGNQGVTITQSPVLMTFTVEGEGAIIRVRQGREWIDVPAAASNAIMVGGAGASAIQVFSRTAPELVVRVTSVQDCATTPCNPLPSAAQEE